MTGVALVAASTMTGCVAQTRPPELVCAGPAGLEHALSSGLSWLWLLGAGAQPDSHALERLLSAAEPGGSAATTIVAGAAVDPRGGLHPGTLPGFDIHDPDVCDLSLRGMVPIRHAPFVNCLVAADAFLAHGLPDEVSFGPLAPTAWTARVLRVSRGYFAADSLVVLSAAAARTLRPLAPALLVRMLRSGAWTRGDALAYACQARDGAGAWA